MNHTSRSLHALLLFVLILYAVGCTTSTTKSNPNPPSAPINLVVTAKSSSSVKLTWIDSSSNEQGFSIERKSGVDWTVTAQVATDTTHYLDTALTPQTAYSYRVNAYNVDGVSAYTNEASVTTPPVGQTFDWTFVSIPAGTFNMGSPGNESGRTTNEGPVHQVTFANGFKMLATEVTQRVWKSVMGTDNNPSFSRGDSLPVEQVSWNETQEFLNRLNQQDSGKGYRLPSEAEWEYACRAGTTTRYHWGDDSDNSQIGNFAWNFDNFTNQTYPVRSKLPNSWGLYDMIGNVWEWCEDDAHPDYNSAPTDGSAWVETPRDTARTWRGGSIRSYDNICRSAKRGGFGAGMGTGWRGFRIVCRGD